jgi:hypothetical protein
MTPLDWEAPIQFDSIELRATVSKRSALEPSSLLYPGWLNIGFMGEFRHVSFGAHVVFGASLGLLVPAGLRRVRWEG